ncbi:MAG TPA: diguanylate cyclase, partial [Thermoanaerobaculia bacterium]|nr:diguanylate cyclase [Thermoanaerobaculia bacterium]
MQSLEPASPEVPPSTEIPASDSHVEQLEILNEVARIATLDLELRPMLQRITDALARKFDWQFVSLASIDDERHGFVCEAVTSSVATAIYVGYGRALGSGVVGEVAATERAVLIDDVRAHPNYVETMPGAQSEICVPVKHKGQLVAILNLESTRLAAFHGQLPLLMTVADQIAGAISSARMYGELKQRARLMEMMSEISRSALATTDLDSLLDRVVQYVQQRFPVELVAILMFDAAKREFMQKAYAGAVELQPRQRWPVAEGIVGRCLRTAETQLVLDVASDPEYRSVNPHVAAELVIPICFDDHILGAMNLESSTPDVFTPANVVAFEAFALQVAGAIHLASVNEKLEATTMQLEQKTRDLESANEHLARAIETLERISAEDGLTGVANRRHFDQALVLEWRRSARSRMPVSLLLIDIDFFKAFNDACGHQAGDDCLRRVAQTLRDTLQRAGDLVARYGGEEFAVLLPDTDAAPAAQIAEVLRERVEAMNVTHPAATYDHVTVSIGVSTTVPERTSVHADTFLRRVD